MSTNLPSDATKTNCDAPTDDPKPAILIDLPGVIDKFNLLQGALGGLAQLQIGNGFTTETQGAGTPDKLHAAVPVVNKTGNYTAVAADRGKLIDFISGAATLSFTAAATLGDSWFCYVRNSNGSGNITLDPNASELIDGAATQVLTVGSSSMVACNGTAFKTASSALGNSGVTAGTYGGASAIPVITFDAKGRATAASTAGFSTTPGPATIGTYHLQVTYGDIGISPGTVARHNLPGGGFGWIPQFWGSQIFENPGQRHCDTKFSGNADDLTQCIQALSPLASVFTDYGGYQASTGYIRQYYLYASPPYDLGDGEIPLFLFALVEHGTGKVLATYEALDPPWAYNGPTKIAPDYVDPVTGKKYRNVRDDTTLPVKFKNKKLKDVAQNDKNEFLDLFRALPVKRIEIDQAWKNADMSVIPHPYTGNNLTGKSVILINPVGVMVERLALLRSEGEMITTMLHAGDLKIDNTPMSNMATPAGVTAYDVTWK